MDRKDFDKVEEWDAQGHKVALATVVAASKSSPRKAGAVMLVRDDGLVHGSVSGGCVEAAVIEAATACLRTGESRELEFGPNSTNAVWEVGLTCGGTIRVYVEPSPYQSDDSDELRAWHESARLTRERQAYVWTTGISPETKGHAVQILDEEVPYHESGVYESEDGARFVDVRLPADRLLIVGGVHIAISLVAMAAALGFETVVVEPRPPFADRARFTTEPDEIVEAWPQAALMRVMVDSSTYAVMLTHDPRIDDQAIIALLETDAPYIGVLGSRTTHAERLERLKSMGVSDDRLVRLRGPVGLDIGAKTAEEIALSILAEIVQVRRRG